MNIYEYFKKYPLSLLAKVMSFLIRVTLLACKAQRSESSNRLTKKFSLATCKAAIPLRERRNPCFGKRVSVTLLTTLVKALLFISNLFSTSFVALNRAELTNFFLLLYDFIFLLRMLQAFFSISKSSSTFFGAFWTASMEVLVLDAPFSIKFPSFFMLFFSRDFPSFFAFSFAFPLGFAFGFPILFPFP